MHAARSHHLDYPGKASHRRSCHRKRRHPTEYRAMEAMHARERSQAYDGRPLKVYFCTHCAGYHVGHAKENQPPEH